MAALLPMKEIADVWLVLCAATDRAALWAANGLRARGLSPLEVVTAETLAQSPRWVHRVGNAGASIEITLGDGRVICSDSTRGVLNRLVSVPFEPLARAHPADSEYAIHELTAFFTSWLYTLQRPVLNRATPQGFCGRWRHPSEWAWLAAQASLPARPYRMGRDPRSCERREKRALPCAPQQTVFVVDEQVIGRHVPAEVCAACRQLARLAETELLGIDFAISAAGWTFAGATPWPDLVSGGEALLDALSTALLRTRELP